MASLHVSFIHLLLYLILISFIGDTVSKVVSKLSKKTLVTSFTSVLLYRQSFSTSKLVISEKFNFPLVCLTWQSLTLWWAKTCTIE